MISRRLFPQPSAGVASNLGKAGALFRRRPIHAVVSRSDPAHAAEIKKVRLRNRFATCSIRVSSGLVSRLGASILKAFDNGDEERQSTGRRDDQDRLDPTWFQSPPSGHLKPAG